MDWPLAIKRNSEDLLGILAMMFTAMGLMPGTVVLANQWGTVSTCPTLKGSHKLKLVGFVRVFE